MGSGRRFDLTRDARTRRISTAGISALRQSNQTVMASSLAGKRTVIPHNYELHRTKMLAPLDI
jgi:hypothetical protein